MTAWIDLMEFPETWVDLRRFRDRLRNRALVSSHSRELRREIAPGHVLCDRDWTLVGLRVPARDDALLRLNDGSLALVHLTWRGAPEPPEWPMTCLVTSLNDLREELADRGYEWDEGR